MANSQKVAKKLPKRTKRRHERKMAMRAKQDARKRARNAANLERAAKNRELRAQGLPTPWEAAKERARRRRK